MKTSPKVCLKRHKKQTMQAKDCVNKIWMFATIPIAIAQKIHQ
jgi:hypothetical protein